MKKTVQAQPCNNSLDLNSNFGYHKDSRNNAMVEGKVCKQKTALNTLKSVKGKEVPDWAYTLHEAQAEDYIIMDTRMSNVEADVKQIKETMLTKDDLIHFKEELIPAIQDSAKYSLVKNTFNWKTALVIIGIIVLAAFGLRSMDFLSMIIEKVF